MTRDSRKDDLKKAWKQQERDRLVASIPMPQQSSHGSASTAATATEK